MTRTKTLFVLVFTLLLSLFLISACDFEASTPTQAPATNTPITPAGTVEQIAEAPGASQPPYPSEAPETQPTASTDAGTSSPDELSIGQTGQGGDFRVTLNKVSYTREGLASPDEGHEYMVANLTLENISQEEKAFSSVLSLSVVDDTSMKYDVALFGPDIELIETTIKNKNPEGRVASGDRVTGDVAFEVPSTAKGLRLVYDSLFPQGKVVFKLDR